MTKIIKDPGIHPLNQAISIWISTIRSHRGSLCFFPGSTGSIRLATLAKVEPAKNSLRKSPEDHLHIFSFWIMTSPCCFFSFLTCNTHIHCHPPNHPNTVATFIFHGSKSAIHWQAQTASKFWGILKLSNQKRPEMLLQFYHFCKFQNLNGWFCEKPSRW